MYSMHRWFTGSTVLKMLILCTGILFFPLACTNIYSTVPAALATVVLLIVQYQN
jgi:hypothetical protein